MSITTLDPFFPQIPRVLEPEFMRKILQASLLHNRRTLDPKIRIESCTVGEKRYKPGKSFLLSYNLKLRDLDTDTGYEQCLTAQLCPKGAHFSEFNALLEKPCYSSLGIPSVSYISEIDMLLWSFPHDRKLIYLHRLLETDNLPSYLSKNLTGLCLGASESIASVQAQIMHYLPEQSCMIRYNVVIADNAANDESIAREVIYGKNYSDDSGLETYSIMNQLAGQTSHCARPLYYDAEIITLWQAHVPGSPLEWDLLMVSENRSLVKKIATCIAGFHRCEIKTEKRYGMPQIQEGLKNSCSLAAAADSALGQRVQGAVYQLFKDREAIEWGGVKHHSPLHLDLKMGNLLIAGQDVYLIDMDCVRLGDPLADTGSFIANLYLNGLRAGADTGEIGRVAAAFIHEYNIAMGGAVNKKRLHWYVAAALIHEVLRRSLRQQCAERVKHIDAYLSVSNRYSALCRENLSHA